ncbi:MAG: hypothetical protein K1X79_11140 [Oligoflexia bacterium]|nr:hypothetical protein [Oligoflexia bacterium]
MKSLSISRVLITAIAGLSIAGTAQAAESKSLIIEIPVVSDNPNVQRELCRDTQRAAGFCGGFFTYITGCALSEGSSERVQRCQCFCNYIGASNSLVDPAQQELGNEPIASEF